MTKITETSIDDFVKKVEPAHVLYLYSKAVKATAAGVEDKCAMFLGQLLCNGRDLSEFYRATTLILRGLVGHAVDNGATRFFLQYHVGRKGVVVAYSDESGLFKAPDLVSAVRSSNHPGIIIVRAVSDEIGVDVRRGRIACAKYSELDLAVPKNYEASAPAL